MFLLQWNLNGYYTRLEKLRILISSKKPIVICLQETNFKGTDSPSLRGYSTFLTNRTRPHGRASGGVATFVQNDYHSEVIPLKTKLEAIAVSVHLDRKISICNIYLPQSQPISTQELQHLAEQLPKPCIILGDFNAHSTLWGDNSRDERGDIVEDFLDQSNLVTLNSGEKTRFNSTTGEFSAIDLSICDPVLSPHLTWTVEDYLYGSDHYPINITNFSQLKSSTTHRNKWSIKNANWYKFTELIEESINEDNHPNSIEEMIRYFKGIILNSAENHIPKVSQTNRHTQVPWWNKNCQHAIQQSKKALYRLKKHNNIENLIEFKRLRARARYLIKQSKKDSWQKYTSTISASTSPSEVWNKIKRIKGINTNFRITSLMHNSKTVTSDNEIVEALADNYCSASGNKNYPPEFLTFRNNEESYQFPDEENIFDPINLPLTYDELENVLKSCTDSSPGPDNIPYSFLTHLPKNAKQYLLGIYNKIYTEKVFPSEWTEATILPIPKPGKPKNLPSSYRPISLTCTMCKLLEKIINLRLSWYLESKNLLAPNQSGFRRNRSATDNITALESDIHEAFANKQHMIAVFFDLEKAYDLTWRFRIVKKLNQMGLNGNILSFVSNFLKNRQFRVQTNGSLSQTKTLENGTPQGSVLSVTLFLIAVNDVNDLIEKPTRSSMFADDLVIYAAGKNIVSVSKLLQSSIDNLIKWTKESGFQFSPDKTKCVLFSRRVVRENPSLKMGNSDLSFAESAKFLGVIFDKKLNWRNHIEHVRTSCSKSLNLLKVLADHKWGADTTCLLRIYRALIRSKIDYGLVAYGTASKTVLKYLERIQSSALRIALGAYRTSPLQTLHCLANEPPLSIRQKMMTITYAINLSANKENPNFSNAFSNRFKSVFNNMNSNQVPLYERVRRELTNLNTQIPGNILQLKTSNIPPWTIPTPCINLELSKHSKSDTPPEVIRSHFTHFKNAHRTAKFLYTDSSKSNEGTSAVVHTEEEVHKSRLPSYCSVFTGELYAIKLALDYIVSKDQYKINIVCSDSLSSLQSLQQTYPSNSIAREIREKAADLSSQGKHIQFYYTPSHIGIRGNEMADQSAKQAVNDPNVAMATICVHKDLKIAINFKLTAQWTATWQNTNYPLKEMKPTPDTRLPLPKARRNQVAITRLRIGHTRLTHEHLMKRTEPPLCETCRTPLNIKHILVECQRFKNERSNNQVPDDIVSALSDGKHLDSVLSFLKDISLLHKI